ncbi:hypothetical protein LINPERHAP1_LOCUS34896, partial [Linum perenne]
LLWWGTKQEGCGGIAWLWWELLCECKDYGGLGFHDICGCNLAMMGKQGRRILTHPNTLDGRIYKAKYYHDDDLFVSYDSK